MKRKLRRFEKIYNKTNSQFNYNNFNTIRKQYRQLLNHTKTCFIKDKINSHKISYHKILLDRLEEIGITDKALDLLKSYFTNRMYRTMINDIQSDEFQLKYGVPQGSVLGPLLFLIYLLPLSLLISKFPQIKFNIFADDIIIILILPLKNNDNSSLINCTNNIRNWLFNNNLLLNIDKTQLINISKNLTQNKFPIYLIDNVIIEPSKTVKCLGVVIDEHMFLDNHLRCTAKKEFYYFSKVKKIRKSMSFHNFKMISQSYIISH